MIDASTDPKTMTNAILSFANIEPLAEDNLTEAERVITRYYAEKDEDEKAKLKDQLRPMGHPRT